jgi:NAD(P) transhydrogenase subunit beta
VTINMSVLEEGKDGEKRVAMLDVLLAEAGAPYDLIHHMDDINGDFADSDVALVFGANDMVNPSARADKSSPIHGMPILNADEARQVCVVKCGHGKGCSGVANRLFYDENCSMVYGDARAVLSRMVQAIKCLGTSTQKAA